MGSENLLDTFHYCTFCLAQLIYIVVYLIIAYGLLRHFKQNSCDGRLPNPSRPLPLYSIKGHLTQKVTSKLSPIKNPHNLHVHNSLSNVAIHMPCVTIHHAGHYQLEVVFVHAHLSLIVMGDTLYKSDCI